MRERLRLKPTIILLFVSVVLIAGVVVLQRWQVKRNANGLLILAQNAQEQRQYARAISLTNRYLQLFPGDIAARIRLAMIYESQIRDSKSLSFVIDSYDSILADDPSQSDARKRLVKLYLGIPDAKQAKKAIVHLDYLHAEQSTDIDLLSYFATAQVQSGNPAAAIAPLRRIIERDPARIQECYLLAKILRETSKTQNPKMTPEEIAKYEKQNIKDADDNVDRMVAANPKSVQAFLARAKYRFEYKNPGFEADIKTALELEPTSLEARLFAASVTPDYATARGHFQEALKFHSTNEQLYLAAMLHEKVSEKRNEAITILRSGREKFPGNPMFMYNLGDLLLETARLPEMTQLVTEMKRWNLPVERVSLYEAKLRMAEGSWEAAEKILDEVRPKFTKLAPSRAAEVNVLLARCYEALGKHEEALAAYRLAMVGAENRTLVYEGLAKNLVLTGRLGDAIDEYRRLASDENARDETLVLYARLLTMQYLETPASSRNFDTLKPAFEKLRNRVPNSADLVILQSQILASDGKFSEAEAKLQNAFRSNPDQTEIGLLLARLLIENKKSADGLKILDQLELKSGPTVDTILVRLNAVSGPEAPQAIATIQAAEKLFETLNAEQKYRLASGLAFTHTQWKKTGEVNRWLRRIVSIRPKDSTVLFQLFDLAVSADDVAEMEKIVQEIQYIEGSASAVGHYAQALRWLSRPKDRTPENLKKVRDHLAEARRLKPGWHSPITSTGVLLDVEGKPSEALEFYRRAVDNGERQYSIFRRILQLYSQLQRYPEAEPFIQFLIRKGHDSVDLRKITAEVSLFNKDSSRAIELADKAVSQSTQFVDYLWQAEFLARAGKNEQAETSFRKAIELAVNQGTPWVALVRHYMLNKQLDKATALISEMQTRLTGPELPLALAQCHEAVRQFDRAEAFYLDTLKKEPNSLESKRQLIGFYERTGNINKAIPLLQSILNEQMSHYDRVALKRSLAFALARTGRYADFNDAILRSEELIATDPTDRSHRIVLARILALRPSHYRKARDLLISLHREQRLESNEEMILAILHADTGNWTEGRRLLTDLVNRNRENPVFLKFLIERLLREGIPAEADLRMPQLERLAPNEPETIYLRAQVLVKLGKMAAAAEQLTKYSSSNADNKRVAVQIADRLSRESGEAKAVLAPLAESLYRDLANSGTPRDLLALCGFLGQLGKIDESFTFGRRAESKEGPEMYAQKLLNIMMAHSEYSNTQLDQLETELKAAMSRSKPSPAAGVVFGLVHARRGRYTEAAESFRSATATNSEDPGLLNNYAYMLVLSRSQPDKVQELLQKVQMLNGDTSSYLDTRGMAHLDAGRTSEAIADLQIAVQQEPSACRCLHLAMALQKVGRSEDARKMLATIAKLKADGSIVIPAEQDAWLKMNQTLN